MAKKRPLPSPPPAPVESSEEEQFSSSDTEEEEEEPQKTSILKNANPNPRKDEEETEEPAEPEEEEEEEEPEEEEEEEEEEEAKEEAPVHLPAPPSESESGSESESDSDESPKAIKPISSKPMPPEPVAVPSHGAFQRKWSLEAEIALLNGLLNYKDSTGTIPQTINRKSGRFADFPDLISSSIGMDVSEIQLSEKIRRLKAKYEKAAARGSAHFSSPHDRTILELSEKIWSNGGAGEEDAAAAENGSEEGRAVGGYRFLKEAVAVRKDICAGFALEALGRMEPGKARSLDEKFKKQKMAAMKLHLHMMDLQKETFKAIMEGVDKSG